MGDFHRGRAEEAIHLLRGVNMDALLLFPGADMGYLAGYSIHPSERLTAALIPSDGEPFLFVNELDRELRGQRPWISDVVVWLEHEDPIKLLGDAIRRRGLGHATIGLATDAYWGWVNTLARMLPHARFADASGLMASLRMVKSPQELEWMAEACEITDASLRAGLANVRDGITEKALDAALTAELKRLGGGDIFCTVLFSDRAALPHGASSDRKLVRSDVILIDVGTTVHGYWSDLTRTMFYGEPKGRQRELYGIVLDANEAAFKAVKPGNRCEDVDSAGRGVIASAGLGACFIHRLGHGVGLQIHEPPYIVKGNALELRAGMTFTIEPGVYMVGEAGIRIEDTVVCVEGGCKRLTAFERTPLVLPMQG